MGVPCKSELHTADEHLETYARRLRSLCELAPAPQVTVRICFEDKNFSVFVTRTSIRAYRVLIDSSDFD